VNETARATDTDPVTDPVTGPAIGDRLYRQLGLRFDRRTVDAVAALALGDIRAPVFYVTCNLNHLRVLQSDRGFRDAYRKAAVVTLDSRPLQMVARLRFGEHLPLVTGADLFAALFERLRAGKDRPFFVSGTDETGGALRRRLLDRGFAPEAVFYQTPPFGFQDDADYGDALMARIHAHRATHLFLGLGAPKSERWVAERLEALPPAHIFCVGAALDFSAGQKNRAPGWVGRIGFEWLHRLLSEPMRLMPRYAGDAMVLAQVLAGRKLMRVALRGAGSTMPPQFSS
jgi:N-acetylglucosaminyldiphosphoundecaprenol N-acetyl-beta-D-mannosaminyltransferase